MDQLVFSVLGSKGDEYVVTFRRAHGRLRATCTCPAGENGQHCKHRIALMSGEYDQVISKNVTDVARIKELVNGTILEQAYQAFVVAERVFRDAERQFDGAKKNLAKAMYG